MQQITIKFTCVHAEYASTRPGPVPNICIQPIRPGRTPRKRVRTTFEYIFMFVMTKCHTFEISPTKCALRFNWKTNPYTRFSLINIAHCRARHGSDMTHLSNRFIFITINPKHVKYWTLGWIKTKLLKNKKNKKLRR